MPCRSRIGLKNSNGSRMGESSITKKTSSSVLSDHSNEQRYASSTTSTIAKAPFLCARLDQRGRTSESKVCCTQVVCRSAPASRAGSRTRTYHNGSPSIRNRRVTDSRAKTRVTSKSTKSLGKRKEIDGVPSLAKTRVQM